MKMLITLGLVLCVGMSLAESESEREARMKWFTDARFGMFIHMGSYSLAGRHEWVKNYENITDEEYMKYARHFNPDLLDAREWARTAKAAGMKYMVLTTKHHEGFSLWDTKYSDYKSTKSPCGRDLVREFSEACRAEGLRVGFYFSLLDWHHPDYTYDYAYPRYQKKTVEELAELNKGKDFNRFLDFMHNQVRELLTNYGKVDILWYDYTAFDDSRFRPRFKTTADWRGVELMKMTRELQPGIIVNDRLGSGVKGDVHTPEQVKEPKWPEKNGVRYPAWEVCQTFSGSWGYYRDEMTWKSPHQLLTILIDTCSKGGNLILNVGPTGRGAFDKRALSRLSAIGEWMKFNNRSIYGCTEAPKEFVAPEGTILTYNPTTRMLYVHLIDYPVEVLPFTFADHVEYAQFLHDASEIRISRPNKVTGEAREGIDASFHLPVVKPGVEIPVIEVYLK